MVRILIVEDDPHLRLLTKKELCKAYQIYEAENGFDALEVLDHVKIDLILIDIMMPRMDGHQLVHQLREAGDQTPVIMLTAMTTFQHKKRGFESGIDDYITKPVNYEELRWRIAALLRRANIASEKRITLGNLILDGIQHTAVYQDEMIPMTNKEFELLFKLLSYPNTVFTKQELLDDIWGYDTETEYETIKTYISKIRNKFSHCKEFQLSALRGIGYKAIVKTEESK